MARNRHLRDGNNSLDIPDGVSLKLGKYDTLPTCDAKRDNHIAVSGGVLHLCDGTTWEAVATVSGLGLTLLDAHAFTASSGASRNSVFSSTYDNYLIVVQLDALSTIAELRMRLRVAAADDSGANYYSSLYYHASNSTSAAIGVAAGTSWIVLDDLGGGTPVSSIIEIKVSRPADAVKTSFAGNAGGQITAALSGGQMLGGFHTQTTAYDGFTLLPTSGTMTGIVRTYGLRDA